MQKILLLLTIVSLAACGTGQVKPLRPGATPSDKKAVFVGRVEIDPAINEYFAAAKESDKRFMTFAMGITPGDGTNIGEWNDDTDVDYADIETNKFFAIEVAPGEPLAIRTISFMASHKAFWLSNTEHIYRTWLSNPSFAIDVTPSAGNAYYIGTIKIGLADRSFKEVGDEKYDTREFHFVVPKNIAIANNHKDATEWFKQTYPKAGRDLQHADMKMKDSGRDNQFRHTSITTTYH